ncbi:MAG: GNAT family N-acetyltransferase [Bacteroidales bacterium]|nr:GNAT family N-acetyltransferase [Bacteroidales bacterium]
MIRFRTLTAQDRALVQSYTFGSDRRGCDISFANLIGWQFLFNTQIAEVEGYLVLRLHFFGDLAYLMPAAKPRILEDGSMGVKPCDACDVNVIRALMEDSASLGRPFLMTGVSRRMADLLEEAMPGVFVIYPNRDYSDYVYFREKLETLAGKKLQSKRNHVNKFLKLYPDWEYKPLTPDMIPACKRLVQQWKATKEAGEPMDSQSMELRAVTRCFNRWEELGLIGGTLWVDGRLVAFTYGNPVNHDTFDVCVEKADVSYEGAFTMINREFVRHLPPQYVYINREEDMGEEGLRKAKLSYHPDILLEKILVREASPQRQHEDYRAIRLECMQLWRDAFHDPEEYVQTYFSKIYRSEDNVCIKSGGRVVAALQTIPFSLSCRGMQLPTSYVSGVAVKDEFRGQNIGTELMHQAHFNMFNNGTVFAVLIPAEPWLREWYGNLGYVSCIHCIEPPAGSQDMSYEEWTAMRRSCGCTLLPGREWFAVAQEELRRSMELSRDGIAENVPMEGQEELHLGSGWGPAPVQGMLRVTDALRALELYAGLHPDARMKLRVTGDEDIPSNNTYYTISAGRVIQSEEPVEAAAKITLADLATLIFSDQDPTMTMMLN